MFLNRLLLVVFVAFLNLTVFAQSGDKEEVRQYFWGNQSPEYTNTKVPEKWKNESAVVLFQQIGYEYSKVPLMKKLSATSYYQSRVLLQDKAAVKDFSEFSFSGTFANSVGISRLKSKSAIGFKIIKPDGTEKIVDLETAVEVESGKKRNAVKKLAIPDLQVGDILDYYYKLDERLDVNATTIHLFDPVITTLNQSYPLMHQVLQYDVGNKFYVFFQTLNGAPELIEKKDGKRKIYRLVVEDMDKNQDRYWYYPYRSSPTIKFQVIFSYTPSFISPYHPQDDETAKNGLTKKEVLAIYREGYLAHSNFPYLKQHLQKKDLWKKNSTKAVEEAYRFLYHRMVGSKIEGYYLDMENIAGNVGSSLLEEMAFYCKRMKIKYNWVVGVPREYADIENALLVSELSRFLSIQAADAKERVFLHAPGLYPHYGEIAAEYEGTSIYSVGDDKTIELPISTFEENQSTTTTTFDFKANDPMELSVKTRAKVSGRNRTWLQGRYLNPYDYVESELRYFGEEMYADANRKSKKITAIREQISTLKTELEKSREESLKTEIEDDFKSEPSNIRDFKVYDDGRLFSNTLDYGFKFDIKGLVSKAGQNYVLQPGKAIGSQVEIPEKGIDRSADIYMPYARSFHNEIIVNIPANYSVQGIENLNKNVVNETGGFQSEAKMEGNVLKIKVKKWYEHNYEPAKNWNEMLRFLEAAYQFTQEKVLLKPASSTGQGSR